MVCFILVLIWCYWQPYMYFVCPGTNESRRQSKSYPTDAKLYFVMITNYTHTYTAWPLTLLRAVCAMLCDIDFCLWFWFHVQNCYFPVYCIGLDTQPFFKMWFTKTSCHTLFITGSDFTSCEIFYDSMCWPYPSGEKTTRNLLLIFTIIPLTPLALQIIGSVLFSFN